MFYNKYKFELKTLNYDYSALEPYIDSVTMHFHHDKHLGTYVDNLNKILEKYPCFQSWSLQSLVKEYNKLPMEIQNSVRNNAGGVYNHKNK
ncbi:MAG: hypothetical protein FWC41_06265 [Firmicutes bacterium]|nr:hypothetical protein [Bacillota bacterium]